MASLLSFGKKLVAQVNPLDQGRTWQHPGVVAPPQGRPASSAFQQATHSGAANFTRQNIINPLAQFPIDVSNQIYNRAVAPTFNLPRMTPTQVAPINGLSRSVGATGSLHQTVGSGLQTALTIGSGGLARGIEAGVGKVVAPRIVPKIVSNAAIGAGFNASAAAGQGAKPADIAKAAGVGAALGGAVPVAGAGLKLGAKGVSKAAQAAKPLDQSGKLNLPFGSKQNLHYSSPNPNTSLTKFSGKASDVRRQLLKLNEGGYIAAGKALGFDKAKSSGKTVLGPEGKRVFEVSDKGMKVKPILKTKTTAHTTLGQVIDHPKLFENYPHLKDMPVGIGNLGKRTTGGGYSRDQQRIIINKNWSLARKENSILHEVQHAIQHHEGLQGGGGYSKVAHIARERIANTPPEKLFNQSRYNDLANQARRVMVQLRDKHGPVILDKNERITSIKDSEAKPLLDKFHSLIKERKNEWAKPTGERIRHQAYEDILGENVSRTVVNRRNLTDAQREAQPFYKNLDSDPKNAIIRQPNGDYVPIDKTTKQRIMRLQKDTSNGIQHQAGTTKPPAPPKAVSQGQAPKASQAVKSAQAPRGVPVKPGSMNATTYAKTFGVSKQQAITDLNRLKNEPGNFDVPEMPKRPVVPKAVEKQLTNPPQEKFRRTQAENTKLNPTKVDIPEVNPGNYQQARINAQSASAPIDYATSQAVKAAQRMSKGEQANIPHLVENPSLAKTPEAKEFVARHQQLTNLTHATSQGLGGNTNFMPNYFRHAVDLSNPKDAARWEELVAKRGGAAADPYAFGGIDNYNRVFNNVKELQSAGFHLKNENNPIQNIIDYGKSSSNTLKKQALLKGFTEADMQAGPKLQTHNLGDGTVIPLSERGKQEIQGFERPAKPGKAYSGYRAVNRKAKQTLLSASEFHSLNIGPKVSGALAAEGHPVLAAKGLYGTFRAQVGRGYSDRLQQSYQTDRLPVVTGAGKTTVNTVEAGARLGTPLKFGSDYANEGKLELGKAGFGEKTIFEKSMPALHGRAIQAAVKDLNKRGISLDSPEAHALGTRINELMGFVKTEVRNLKPGRQRALSDIAFAPQFTRSKWATLKSALSEGGLAGSYARRAVVANAATDFVFIAGLGYALKQKSDNARDILMRAIFSPSVPTPLKDSKGNNIQLKTPSSYASEALGLIATLERGKDGHLTPKFEPLKVPGNVANYGRNRLAIVPANALKVATNTNYAGKPLYDPNAKFGTKAEQGATTVGTGLLPIGLQGVAQTKAVKSRLPGNVQDVINANSPGANPLVKSIGSSFGLTPTTDRTVGKGLETTTYFNAVDKYKSGLDRQSKDAYDLWTGSKKNPVTGKYDVAPNANDARTKASALLQNPKALNNLVAMNQDLAKQGQKVDPLWRLPKNQITSYLQYQNMAPGSADKTDWVNKHSWYYGDPNNKNDQGVAGQRTAFFDSLPKGDPNKPKLDLQYPEAPKQVKDLMDQYSNLSDSSQKGAFLDAHPDVINQWNKQSKYTNDLREKLGYAPLKNYPEASTQLQVYMDKYNSADKATRKGIRNSDPKSYQSMIAYFDSLDLYNINKQGSVNQLQGEPDQTSKQNKAISSLAKDIYQNADGTYQIVPAGWMQGLKNGYGGFGGFQKKPSYAGFKTASKSKITPPKGVKVTVPKYASSTKTKKLSVSKIPTIYKSKRLA